jgi:hypothetical protein
MTAPQEILSTGADRAEPGTHAGSSATILFTAQEVAFSTAAAVPVRPAKTRRWVAPTTGVLAAMHRIVARLAPEERVAQRYYSNHYDFLEEACMAREMGRL